MLLTLAPTVSVQGVKAGIINLVAIRLKQRKKPEADPVMKAELMELSMCVISLCCVWCGRELVSAFSLVLELYCSLFWYHMYITKIIVFVSLTERERPLSETQSFVVIFICSLSIITQTRANMNDTINPDPSEHMLTMSVNKDNLRNVCVILSTVTK